MKRSPIERRTELQRTPWKRRYKRPVVSAAVQAEVLERAGFRCERCHESAALHLHHKLRRSQGGAHDASNLVALCPRCHSWTHDNPKEASEQGWLIRRGTAEA